VVLVIVLWSFLLGWGLSLAMGAPQVAMAQMPSAESTASRPTPIDRVPTDLNLAVETYQTVCGSCHVAIPPQLLPTQRWVEIMENPVQHFGVNLRTPRQAGRNVPPVTNIDIRLMWDYMQFASRRYREENDPLPTRVADSRFFWAVHPRVAETCRVAAADPTAAPDISCPDRATVQSCVGCHPAARQFNYAELTPAWENSL
jgi:hypothetical protein